MKRKQLKIIFLDIDGVLQPSGYQYRFRCDMDLLQKCLAQQYNDDLYMEMSKYDIAAAYCDWEEDAVERLRSLIKKTGAKIVISSDWRSFNNLAKMKLLFKIYDLDEHVIDLTTEELKDCFRDGEIDDYLFHHPEISQFVIIDDRYEEWFMRRFPDNFVKTYPKFEDKDYDLALKILKRPSSNKKLNEMIKLIERVSKNDKKLIKAEFTLEKFSLFRYSIQKTNSETLDIICDALSKNSTLKSLSIFGIGAIFHEKTFNTGRILDEKLAEVLISNNSIKQLKLINNSMDNISNICSSLTNRKTPLEFLDLYSNTLHDNGQEALAKYLESLTSPLTINLKSSCHEIDYDLLEALKNKPEIKATIWRHQIPSYFQSKIPANLDAPWR